MNRSALSEDASLTFSLSVIHSKHTNWRHLSAQLQKDGQRSCAVENRLKTARDDDYSLCITDEDEMSTPARLPIPNIDHYLPHASELPVPYRQWIKTFRQFATIINYGCSPAEQLMVLQKNGYPSLHVPWGQGMATVRQRSGGRPDRQYEPHCVRESSGGSRLGRH